MTNWVLVPREPTQQMCEAARKESAREFSCPEDIGRAYVAAAPAPQQDPNICHVIHYCAVHKHLEPTVHTFSVQAMTAVPYCPACHPDVAHPARTESVTQQEPVQLHEEVMLRIRCHKCGNEQDEQRPDQWKRPFAIPTALQDAEFKNFHRALCDRFGYVHDPVDWRRDQVSLIEHIAKSIAASAAHRLLAPGETDDSSLGIRKSVTASGRSGASRPSKKNDYEDAVQQMLEWKRMYQSFSESKREDKMSIATLEADNARLRQIIVELLPAINRWANDAECLALKTKARAALEQK